MTQWAAKRFWTEVRAEPEGDGFAITLDGRPVRTPGRRPLRMPSAEMAEAAAAEWAAQGELIDPATMPVTRSANSALDQTGPAREAVIDLLAAYAETDLLCHRAAEPAALAARQAEHWQPLLDWAAERFAAPLVATAGILPVAQPPAACANLRAAIATYGDFGLTGLHDLIVHSGSAVLGLAVAEGHCTPEHGWTASRIDEDWQIAQWGEDEIAAETAKKTQSAFLHAARFLRWSGRA